MQTSIAQAAALAIFGNDVIHEYARTDFWPASTVFTFCKSVRFVALGAEKQAPSESLFAEDPIQWASTVRGTGAVGLRLHYVARNDPRISDRMSVGFVGGGSRWLIESFQSGRSDLWEAKWLVGNKDDPDRKIWDVTYYRVGTNRVSLPFRPTSLVTLRDDLKSALSKIEIFATQQKLEFFAKAFRDAREILSSEAPFSGVYHPDIAPTPNVPVEAKQLLGAAQTAWVFGGMGSWNDVGFEALDQKEYEVLSDDLFSLLHQAIGAAVNSYSLDGKAFREW